MNRKMTNRRIWFLFIAEYIAVQYNFYIFIIYNKQNKMCAAKIPLRNYMLPVEIYVWSVRANRLTRARFLKRRTELECRKQCVRTICVIWLRSCSNIKNIQTNKYDMFIFLYVLIFNTARLGWEYLYMLIFLWPFEECDQLWSQKTFTDVIWLQFLCPFKPHTKWQQNAESFQHARNATKKSLPKFLPIIIFQNNCWEAPKRISAMIGMIATSAR